MGTPYRVDYQRCAETILGCALVYWAIANYHLKSPMHEVQFYQQLALVMGHWMTGALAHLPPSLLAHLERQPAKLGYLLYCAPWGALFAWAAIIDLKALRRTSAIFVCAGFTFVGVGIYMDSGFVPAVGPYAAAAVISGITGLGIPRG